MRIAIIGQQDFGYGSRWPAANMTLRRNPAGRSLS
jgi:hypothetical protein